MDSIVWKRIKKKKKKRREERVNRGNGERVRKSKEEEEYGWVCEMREMKHQNKSNNDVACFHWLA